MKHLAHLGQRVKALQAGHTLTEQEAELLTAVGTELERLSGTLERAVLSVARSSYVDGLSDATRAYGIRR